MSKEAKQKRLSLLGKCLLFCMLFIASFYNSYAQPANDNCANAQVINITNSGYDTGTFSSSNIDITSATVQAGETFAPAILVAGQNQKSIWFKFTLPTNCGVQVTLLQSGTVITAGDVGFAVYKSSNCLPANADVSTKLTPLERFGNTLHPCVEPGEYLVQVSSKANVSGTVYVQVKTDTATGIYDRPVRAYQFGKLLSPTNHIDFSVDCQSLDNAAEMCTALSNYQQYKKSTWHTFTTPDYFDYLSVLVASPNGGFPNGVNVFGYRLYKGNARTTDVSSLTPVGSCDSLKTSGYYPGYKTYRCGELEPNTTYSIQLLYKQDFEQNLRLAVAFGGIAPTQAPQPILSSIPASNQLGALASSPSGVTTTAADYLACNARHVTHACGDALPATGILYNGNSYNLSTFYTFTLAAASNISMSAYSSTCNNATLLLRLYKQGVSNNCASLSNTDVSGAALTSLNLECMPPGTYTLQISGRDTASPEYNYTYGSLGSGSPLCMFSNLGQKVDLSIRVNTVNALNKYPLNVNDAYDKINALTALQNGIAYRAMPDTFGCSATVLPSDKLCDTTYNKAMYREFLIADSGIVTLTNKNNPFLYRLYKGDANALAIQQNKHSFPDRITGLTTYSECRNYYEYCIDQKVCVVPGTYTLTTFGGSNYVNIQDRPSLQFDTLNTRHYSPATAQDMGSILDSSSTALTSDVDYFSCKDNAVTINGYAPCTMSGHPATKAIYRQFYLKAPSIVTIYGSGTCGSGGTKTLFSGKAMDGIAGLQPLGDPWNCFSSAQLADRCKPLPAGWYTVVSYGSGPSYENPVKNLNEKGYSSYVATSDQFTITVTTACEGPRYNRPYKAATDTVTHQPFLIDWPSGRGNAGQKYLYTEHFNCTVDTPFNSGVTACSPSLNRVAYYVFKTTKASSIQISFQALRNVVYSVYALDVRKDSSLLKTAIPVLSCASGYDNRQICNLPPGTYTLVAFTGDDFNCLALTPVITKPCNEPWYNRPYKAAVDTITKNPFLIEWAPRKGSTPAYPKTDTTYNFYTEYFDCSTDTPFSTHPVISCDPSVNRVAYYVFQVTKESYVQINTQGLWGSVYAFDVRKDSSLFLTAPPVQPCLQSTGYIQLCRLQPGVYTLIIFAGNSYSICSSVTPTIYIDQVGYSRFDHANKAYDFGTVPPDSLYHSGKTGDVNLLNAGRAASNDFFYCTTGSQKSDPVESACYVDYNPLIYNTRDNNYLFTSSTVKSTARRNLWYTFVVDKPGDIRIKVTNKTTGKLNQYPYAVYKSDVDPSLPFSAVVSTGQVDSTTSQGLSYVKSNKNGDIYCNFLVPEISFYREPCTFIPTRYYIVVDNNSSNEPNSQVEVSVLLDSTSAILPKFDHYFQASDMGVLGAGTYKGDTDNYTCATKDANDPVYNDYRNCGKKTLWYKFTSTVTGQVRYRIYNNGQVYYYNDKVQLFKQVIPNDSTSAGLIYQNSTNIYDNPGGYWLANCVSPSTYYLLITGCDQVNEFVYPEVKITEQAGDVCSAAVPAVVNGPGSTVSSVLIDCHTIGTDYGEFAPNLTCPANAKTKDYKSSWFKIDISGSDTLDVTTYLAENTTANPSDIQYRLMTGNCGAMQEQSCVQDAQTRNTYKCLSPGSYYVQIFTPVTKNGYPVTGNIELHLTAVKHVDSCAPVSNCLANANFVPQFDCTTDSAVRFVNYSTYGSSIIYKWDFGYGGRTSSEVSPSFFYPALAINQTYIVKLEIENTSCGGKNSVTLPVNVPGRPAVNLGNDIKLCEAGSTVTLDATSFAGAKYLWQDGSVNPTFKASLSNENRYTVKVSYNGCISTDTIKVFINPIRKNSIKNYVLCGGDSVQLYDYRGYGETYLWSTGYAGSSFYAKNPGTYWIDILLNGCTVRDSFNVTSVANAHPLGDDRAVCSVSFPYKLDATTTGASYYRWQDGSGGAQKIVSAPGLYWVDVFTGNCSFRDSITLSLVSAAMSNISTTLCAGKLYTLPSGRIVSATGSYKDTLRNISGCDSLITIVNLTITPPLTSNVIASVCSGQTYTLPSGRIVNATGTYVDSLKAAGGCDSVITINLTVKPALTSNVNASVCSGQTYTLPSGRIVIATGTYVDSLKAAGGCDSVITINLTVKPALTSNFNASVCSGQTYTLPSGRIVIATGTYVDSLKAAGGCDSVITINLTVKPALTSNVNASVCSGQTYTLPSGRIVFATGTYVDSLKAAGGCDSVITINLTVKPALTSNVNASVCSGQTYTLPSGRIVIATGTYIDSLKAAGGCDSVVTTNLTVKAVLTSNVSASVCSGQTYTLPSGRVVNATGMYVDSLKAAGGCDSVVTTYLTVKSALTLNVIASVCTGLTYTLPSGRIVIATGTYVDSLKAAGGCDSVITINLNVKPALTSNFNASVCSGQTYTLPSGRVVNATGMYVDSLKAAGGCDSVVTTNLMVKPVLTSSINASVCSGQTYTLPSGRIVNATGTYIDSLKAAGGCDSVITTNLTVKAALTSNVSAAVCSGQTYTLPSGRVVNATGMYVDSLKAAGGCDSVVTTNLMVKPVLTSSINASVCSGQTYTLPSGRIVNATGTYIDSLKAAGGCDSVITTNLTVKAALTSNVSAAVCTGQTYTLPSGRIVIATGTYVDSLKAAGGCDSVVTTNLTVKPILSSNVIASVCAGQTYTLPSGHIVNATGTYVDSLKAASGCDSVVTTNLTVKTALASNVNASVCAGQTYMLPSGRLVNSTGTYVDSLKAGGDCDSVITTNLTVKSVLTSNINASVCAGQNYTLPSGRIVNATGTYVDSLKAAGGCDSVVTTHLTVKPVLTSNVNASVCSGQTYTLPSGRIAIATGTYVDSLKAVGGCDSVVTTNLIVKSILTSNVNAAVCAGQTYTLPSGRIVSIAGIYSDTVRSINGCDSLITKVSLKALSKPIVRLSKSNDINCTIAFSHLTATGGQTYSWTPPSSLNNSQVFNPVASPIQTTTYYVKVTSTEGCENKDSIQVKVATDNGQYELPNAFTPNGDGKNDCFGVKMLGIISDFSLSIFNRLGQEVFKTTNPSQCWDGTYKGELQQTGGFVYYVRGKTICGEINKKGTVVLIR